ncbi:methyltransferase [archaeon]|jgi:putative methylase|nr:methyltransferase [archaeon]
MTFIPSQKQLEMVLQRLSGFENPSASLEQYQTPAGIAASWIWSMHMQGEVEGKVFADLAAGPGILGLGLLLMGAKKVHFVDIDEKTIITAKENLKFIEDLAKHNNAGLGEAVFHNVDVQEFDLKVDCVVQNPPFGTKQKHIDKLFLETAFKIAPLVYSMHKITTEKFVVAISKDYEFRIESLQEFKFSLPKTMKHHKKRIEYTQVGLWKLKKVEK